MIDIRLVIITLAAILIGPVGMLIFAPPFVAGSKLIIIGLNGLME